LYFRPTTLDEAVDTLSRHGGQILSGGTDFFPALGERPISSPVIDISGIAQLRGVSIGADEIRIGGLTTWTEILRAPLPRCFDALKAAAREVGSIQIQNRGTVAGNLCYASPAADGVPPLLALDAEVELSSQAGVRRIPLAQFLVGNRRTVRRADEVLSAVIIPRGIDDARSAFLKLGSRRYLVISIVMVTIGLSIFFQALLKWMFGVFTQPFPQVFSTQTVNILGLNVESAYLMSLAISLVIMAGFAWFFKYSRLGLAMRATAFDQQVAQSLGVSVRQVFAVSWAISAMVSALAGVVVGLVSGVSASVATVGVKVFPAVIVGGLESIVGAVLGGLIIGLLEGLAQYLDAEYLHFGNLITIAPFYAMLLILLIKPYGLFGSKNIERV
jgi:branched-subunit amino acid ABC-type transport system permease component